MRISDWSSDVCSSDLVDFSDEAFPFMSFREGTVSGVFARIMGISFSGERSYEVIVPANYGQGVWDAIIDAGGEYEITPYGTDTMHVQPTEKGYTIVGQDHEARGDRKSSR